MPSARRKRLPCSTKRRAARPGPVGAHRKVGRTGWTRALPPMARGTARPSQGRGFKLFRRAFGAAMAGGRGRRRGNMRRRGGRDCLPVGQRQHPREVPHRIRPESGDEREAFRLHRVVQGHGHHRRDRQGARRKRTLIVEGPNTDSLYRLGLRNDNVPAKDQAYAKLQASGLVTLILPEK